MNKIDICAYCHHTEAEHNSNRFHCCSGSVSDGQSEIGCYCQKYKKETQEDIDRSNEYQTERYNRYLEEDYIFLKIYNKVKNFFKK